ncbi:hypothetical protein BDV28DRAFT_147847 [Aspergillus coremiiformis]|uniref:Uncharacterized protein n=1 Tax=Aspergillus coremiiformis TaxID=138285 RepID=A0A5N6ZAD5_9EURO|nr:hypothetical protein BDV28DRAFT_147847 [Aspergillus coremiiformis]
MASAHPEGEVFFRRSSLRFNNNQQWNADSATFFYRHCLIEWVSNEPMARQSGRLPDHHTHPRSFYGRGRGPGMFYNVHFGFWRQLPVSLGEHNNIRRCFQLELETSLTRFKEREQGAAQRLLTPIRAIYLPVAQFADEDFPHLCTYVQINFYQQGQRDIFRPHLGYFLRHQFTPEFGVGFHPTATMGLNIHECIKLLALPPKLRVTNIWRSRLVVIRHMGNIRHPTPQVIPRQFFDFINFINANFAVDVIWKPMPPQNRFILDLVSTVISAALGCVPGIGPLLSAGFTVAWQAATDPDGFREWARSGGWALTLIETVIGSADSMRGYVHPSWQGGNPRLLEAAPASGEPGPVEAQGEEKEQREEPDWEHAGPSELLLYGLRIMAFSATSGKSEHDGILHTEILRRVVESGAMSLSEALAVERGLEALPEDDVEGGEAEGEGTRVEEAEGEEVEGKGTEGEGTGVEEAGLASNE